MDITDVKIFPVDEEKLKAYVTITLDGCFVVRDLKVIQGSAGLFVAMPAKKRKDGTYKDIAHPLNTDMRRGWSASSSTSTSGARRGSARPSAHSLFAALPQRRRWSR
jgi:DNA-binding cell septation regulator SpoVG